MRIAVQAQSIVPTVSCGVENFTYGLVSALAAQSPDDHEFYVTVPRGTRDEWRERLADLPNLALVEIAATASLARPSGILSPMRAAHTAARLAYRSVAVRRALRVARLRVESRSLKRIRPDLVYYPFHLSDGQGSPSVVTVHDLAFTQPGFRDDAHLAAVATRVRRAAAVVTSWPHPRAHLLEVFPELAEKLFVIPFPPMIDVAMHGGSVADDAGPPLLLYPAGTAPHKNHVRLIEAFARIVKQHDARLLCTGTKLQPGYRDAVEAAKRLGVEDRVRFAGFLSEAETARAYRRAAVVVVPSLWEAASGPVFEAFAAGTPVACSDIDPIRMQVELCGATVRFFDPLDADAIADAVLAVLVDPQQYERGARAGASFLSSLSWSQTATDYQRVFDWVAGDASRPPRAVNGRVSSTSSGQTALEGVT